MRHDLAHIAPNEHPKGNQAIKARLDNIEAFLSGDQSQGSSHASGDEGNYEFINFEVKKAKSIIATSSDKLHCAGTLVASCCC
jgi:hypothetical protein